MNILLLLNTLVLFLEMVKTHENVKRNKSKGHSAQTLQPYTTLWRVIYSQKASSWLEARRLLGLRAI